ncbi:MAG: hypothetical protein IBX62_02720 [Coriobacteriia bacterium]|nr:hypothetical protein [Coriobacteriia bacterium]
MILPFATSPPPLDFTGEEVPPLLQARLADLEPVLAVVYRLRVEVLAAFALVAAVVVISGLAAGLGGRIRRPAAWRLALLAVLAFPAASVTMFLLVPRPGTVGLFLLALAGAWAVLLAASAALAVLRGPRRALTALLLGTAAAMLADQWLGGPVAPLSVLSYSPLDGVRFYGLGNEGAAVLFGSGLLGAGLCCDGAPPGARRDVLVRLALPLVGASVVLTSAAPGLGANVTVALWATAGFAVAALLARGRAIGWREAAAASAVAALTVVALAALDLARADGGTHLARSLRAFGDGGVSALLPMIAAKVAINLRVLTATPGSLVVLAAMGWFAYALRRPSPRLAGLLAPRPVLRASLVGALVGSALGMVTEDSGVAIPALVLLYAGGVLAYAAAMPAACPGAEAPARTAAGEGSGGRGEGVEGVGE